MTPADIDPARILAWIEKEQERARAEADAATEAYLSTLFTPNIDEAAGRRISQLTGKYIALAEMAGAVRSGKFDRRP